MLFAAKRLAFRIVNPKIAHDRFDIKKDSSLPLYPIFGMKETKTGIMVLNKPDNNNNVTEEFADELFRFLSSYHHDHTVENVWMENRGSSFSGGADLQALVKNPDYLDKLMRLSIKVGEFNKPIFAKVDGSVRGIGAYLVSMLSTPMATPNSSLRIDETAKGFVPIFGGSWRLSRLPCNIGIYLALTGDSLDADQMARLGFLRGKVRDEFTTKRIIRHLSDANLFMRNPYTPSSFTMSEIRRQNMILFRKNYFYDLLSETQKQIYRAGGSANTKMALSQHRLAMTEYYNTIRPYNSLSDKNSIVNNYFAMRHDRPFSYLKDKQILEDGETHHHLIARLPVPKLLKVFNRDDVKGVLEQLQKDGSEWAKKTEEMIRAKDPLAVNLVFHMIKNAKTMSWVECLEQEYKIARRILTISKTTCRQISKDRSLIVLENPHSKQKPEQISKETISNFFRPAKTELQIFSHDTPNHSLFPTSDYWRAIPDAARNYLNRTFFEDYHSKFGEVEVVRFLNQYKIDYRDSSYNIAKLRESLYKKLDWDRLVQLERQRIRGIFQADVFYKQQKQQRKKYLQAQLKSPELPKLVATTIKQYFEEQFNSKFDELDKTSKIAGKQSRMEVLRKYAHTLTENIVFQGRKIEDVDRLSNSRHEGLVRFDQKGSDVWHAETEAERNDSNLNALKEAYIQGRDPSKLSIIDPQKAKPLPQREFTNWEFDILRKDTALQLNYGKTILPKQKAKTYRLLMERAAKTSQQISAMLGWEDSDIQNVLINSPQKVVTFRQFADDTLTKAPKIEERIELLNKAYESFGEIKEKQVPRILSPEPQASTKHIFFNQKVIARPFRQIHLALFEEVLNYYSEKYEIKNSLSTGAQSIGKSEFLSKWSSQSLKEGFNKLMKSDVEYTFSYLIILHLKQIISEIQKLRPKGANELTGFLQSKFNLNFSGANWNQVNQIFMGYLYAMLDMHQESKHKIIFPQTKMVQFLNRFKINAENNSKSSLSFESFMLLIARDRKMIRDMQNGKQPLLGYDPEVNLNTLQTQYQENSKSFKEDDAYLSKSDQINNLDPVFYPIDRMISLSNNLQHGTETLKKLVLGYQHYLRRFEAILQQAAGDTMFLPKTLYEYEGKKTYEAVKDLLQVELNEEQWLKSKIKSAVKNLMNFRLEKEKDMTEGELRMFDEQFAQLLSTDLLGLVIKYQCYHEELAAKLFINDGSKTSPGTNDLIESTYLDFMGEIRNSKSLKILNTLMMSEQVVRARLQQIEQEEDSGEFKQTQVTREELIDLNGTKNRSINLRTYDRLISDALRYSEPVQLNKQSTKSTRNMLGQPKDTRDTLFINELKQISQLLDGNDIRSELQNRIHRIETLYRD